MVGWTRKDRWLWSLLGVWLAVAILASGATAAAASTAVLWDMENEADIAGFTNDNTGSVFALSTDVAVDGTHSLRLTPSGQALETKLSLPLEGERLARWQGADTLVVQVYLAENSSLLPTMYFLGMADVTGDWSWVDGVFAQVTPHPGWNEVRFKLSPPMMKAKPTGRYILYFAFAGFDANKNKIPLKDAIYLDHITAEGVAGAAAAAPLTDEQAQARLQARLAQAPPAARQDATATSNLTDAALLDEISRRAFLYFWQEANPSNGLIRDRSTPDSPCSIAAVGFGLSALPIAIEQGWISRQAGYERALATLRTFATGGVEGEHGFFYHFVDMQSGRRVQSSELSSIDTALFLAGALTVGQYFPETEVAELADRLYQDADWTWMQAGGVTLSMGWTPEGGFLPARWDSFNEDLILYVLAIGSPTHPIPAATWDLLSRPTRGDHIFVSGEPLFVYQYPLAWLDLRQVADRYTNYWDNAVRATRYNAEFSRSFAGEYRTYRGGVWGLSASDGPRGYRAYGAAGQPDGTIAPYASVAAYPFTPDLSITSIRSMLTRYGPLVWGKYGFVSAFNEDEDWYSDQYIGIDQGIILLMLENARSGLIWRLFGQNLPIQEALRKIGFQPLQTQG